MTNNEVNRLVDALGAEFPGAEVDAEEISAGRYRVAVVWAGFDTLSHRDRQRRAWKTADAVVPGQVLLDVGMILTMAPSELPQAQP